MEAVVEFKSYNYSHTGNDPLQPGQNMDAIHVSSYEKIQLVKVSVDTYSYFVYVSGYTDKFQNILSLIASPNLPL